MASNPQQLEGGNTHDYGSTANTSSIDELPAFMRGAMEVIAIQSFDRLIRPRFESLARRVVVEELQKLSSSMKEHINFRVAEEVQKLSTNMKENPASKASAPVLNKLKLRFSNKISQPVFTAKDLLGENQTPIEIVLVDPLTDQIVKVGTESTAKLEIVALQVGDDDGNDDDSWTNEKFEERIVTEKNGTHILQGITRMRLKEGIVFVDKISFTQSSKWTKRGSYRLGARVLDIGLMNRVEAARTEAFLVKDHRNTFHRKHYPPSSSDKVYRLKQIGPKGKRYKRLKAAKVGTVEKLLTLLHNNPKQLEQLLDLKASSTIWNEIVNHAQTCVGYIPADQLSDKQKVDTQKLVELASENLEELRPLEDETSHEILQSDTSFNPLSSANQSLGTSMIIGGPPSLSSQAEAYELVISAFQQSEELVFYDDEASLRTGACPTSEDVYPLNAQMVGGYPESSKMKSSHQKARFDYAQTSAASDPDVMPPIYYDETVGSLNKHGLNSMGLGDVRFDQTFNFHCQVSDNEDIECMLDQTFNFHCQVSHNEDIEDIECMLDGFIIPYAVGQRKWNVVSSVLKGFSLLLEIRKRQCDSIQTLNENTVGAIASGFKHCV